MLKDITIGQYYPVDSFVHRLDPRTKLFAMVVFIFCLFLCHSWLAYLITGIVLGIGILQAKIPISYLLKGLKSVFFLILFSVSLNLFLTSGEVIWQFGILRVTKEGLSVAALMCIRLVFLMLASSLMTLTTTPNQLTDGLEKGLSILNKIKIPVHELAMMMSISLRFIPILVEETDKIQKAQMARGANFEKGNIIKRAKNLIPLFVPLFISALRRASDLAMAMEVRCYRGGEYRTKMKPLVYQKADYFTYAFLGIFAIGIVYGYVWWKQ
ncbi:energy-coupling factor transporter transmembrane protein EcfT [Clostridia bacterium]|nr:energy-coupling factor transporter transmembrane protein EcfT [Clostridia bacterium]